jgi:endonuclease VIII
MPEGDTIFRTARSLGRALGGEAVTAFRSTYPTLTRFHDDAPIIGRTVDSVEARGKWLLIHFSGGATLATHMLMNGSWHIYRHGERWLKSRLDMRILIENSRFVAVGFKVPVAEMHTPDSLKRQRRIPALEIDVLRGEFDEAEVTRRVLSHGGESIADVLLDQSVMAGVGNEFKSEICFVTGIHPYCPVASLSAEQVDAIIAASRRLVGANVLEDSGDRVVTYLGRGRRTTNFSDPTASVWVYGRNGQPCRRCGEAIRRRIQGKDARVTFWCPRCQPMPNGSDVDG